MIQIQNPEGWNFFTLATVTCGLNFVYSRKIPSGSRRSSICAFRSDDLPPSFPEVQITRGLEGLLKKTPRKVIS